MDLLYSFLAILVSACVAQILIDRNEINRVKGSANDEKRAEAGTPIKKVYQIADRRNKGTPQIDRPAIKRRAVSF